MPKGYSEYNQGGWHHTEETKQGISATLNELYKDPAERNKHISWAGRHHTPEEIAKISKANKGSNNAMWKLDIGAIVVEYAEGKSLNELMKKHGGSFYTWRDYVRPALVAAGVSRDKLASRRLAAKQGKFSVYGEANRFWKGGIWPSSYPPEFTETLKEEIRERDNRTCQRCGIIEAKLTRALDVHHKNGKDKNTHKDLISYCGSCHIVVELELGEYINRDEVTGRYFGVKEVVKVKCHS